MAANPFEDLIFTGMLNIVGNPILIGFLVFGWFLAFVLLQGVNNFATKLAILIPAALLASAFVPFAPLLVALLTATLIYFALMRVVGK